ncbi:sensor histidine kinase [Bailinhaonella thermotolerans]|uniref:histidine kinase n=1 Tax=Bailinhaonella thermotolerans TaxID=1070861 RepID=A0A3A4A1P6_9ACTN|nr:histidine kinase [Bailinhaonella thermotolerans]RJL22108.1 two-component sensor histidine kinase [Bailinhaonella thermotolerans]
MRWTGTRETTRIDLGVALLAFSGGVVLLLLDVYSDHVRRQPPTIFLLGLGLVCAAVAVRRGSLALSLILGTAGFVVDLISGPTLATPLIYTENLYSATINGSHRLSRILLYVSVAATLALTAAALVLGGNLSSGAAVLLIGGLILVSPVVTAITVREHRDRAEAAREHAEQVALLAEMDRRAAVNAERTRMARELHDMIANHFSAIAIQSTAVLSREDLDRETTRRILTTIRENSVLGLAEMRKMIDLLRQEGDPEDEPTRHRIADVSQLVERANAAGLSTRLKVDGEAREISAAIDLAGYRIVQEALTNALKHGGPGDATVEIAFGEEQVEILVDNTIVPGHRAGLPGSAAGLVGMKERASLVGGDFTAGPREGGWQVRAVLPIQEKR